MKLITLNRRTARLLREQLTSDQHTYDYVDLCKLDWLAKKLTGLEGDYAERMAALVREEKGIRRELGRGRIAEGEATRLLMAIQYDAEELHEAAETVAVALQLEDADHKLICDKVLSVGNWRGAEEIRGLILTMVAAVKDAESVDPTGAQGQSEEPTPLRAANGAEGAPAKRR